MRSDIRIRLARLEHRDEHKHQCATVIHLLPDGTVENSDVLAGAGPFLFLPRKSASPEAWVAECRARFTQREAWRTTP